LLPSQWWVESRASGCPPVGTARREVRSLVWFSPLGSSSRFVCLFSLSRLLSVEGRGAGGGGGGGIAAVGFFFFFFFFI
jgi:hypothetical protein